MTTTKYTVVCPITTEPIKVFGMTVLGQVYEYDSIVEWLKDHYTEPITNDMLPSNFVVKMEYPPESDEDLIMKRENMRLTTKLWAGEISLRSNSIKLIENVEQVKKEVEKYKLTNAEKWYEFESQVIKAWLNPNVTSLSCFGGNFDGTLHIYNRKEETAISIKMDIFEGLSHLILPEMFHYERDFKMTKFDASDLRKQTFYRCGLSRTSFISSDLRGTTFIGCTFSGENTNFANCIVDETTQFSYCNLEMIGRWLTCNTVDKFRNTLYGRGMDQSNKVRVVMDDSDNDE